MSATERITRGLSAAGALRASVFGVAATVFWWTLSVRAGVMAAATGAVWASLAADRLARFRPPVRAASALGIAFAVSLLGGAIANWLLQVDFVSQWIGSIAAVQLAEVVRCASFTAPAVFALRFFAARYPAAVVVEVFVVAAAFVAAVAAHREGIAPDFPVRQRQLPQHLRIRRFRDIEDRERRRPMLVGDIHVAAAVLDLHRHAFAEIGRAEDEDLQTVRPGLVASPRAGRDAHRVPFLELDDLVDVGRAPDVGRLRLAAVAAGFLADVPAVPEEGRAPGLGVRIAGCARRNFGNGFTTIVGSSMSESRLPTRTHEPSTSQSAIPSASSATSLSR